MKNPTTTHARPPRPSKAALGIQPSQMEHVEPQNVADRDYRAGFEAGKAQGIAEERERIAAWLERHAQRGVMGHECAPQAIRDGDHLKP